MAFIDDVRKTTIDADKAKRREARSAKAKESAAVRKSKNEGRSYARNVSFEEIKRKIKEVATSGAKEYVARVGEVSYESGYFSYMTAETKADMAFAEAELDTLAKMFKKAGFAVTPETKHGSSAWDNDGCPTESYISYKLKIEW